VKNKLSKRGIILILVVVIILIVGGCIIAFSKLHNEEADSYESIIKLKYGSQEIEAITGSFCYSEACIDKVDPLDFDYQENFDVTTGSKIEILDLDNTVTDVFVYSLETRETIDIEVEFNDDSLTIPELYGNYVIEIESTYEEKEISYYFMVGVNVQK